MQCNYAHFEKKKHLHCFRVFWRFTIVLKWLGPPRLGQLFRAVAATRIPVAPRAVPPDCAGFQLWNESLGPDRDNASQMTLALEHRENWIPKNYHPKRETLLKDVNYRDPYKHTKKGQISFPRVGLSTLCWCASRPRKVWWKDFVNGWKNSSVVASSGSCLVWTQRESEAIGDLGRASTGHGSSWFYGLQSVEGAFEQFIKRHML